MSVPVIEAQDIAAAETAPRDEMRHALDRLERKRALHDIAEGLRAIIRAAPLASLAAGVYIGMRLSARRPSRR